MELKVAHITSADNLSRGNPFNGIESIYHVVGVDNIFEFIENPFNGIESLAAAALYIASGKTNPFNGIESPRKLQPAARVLAPCGGESIQWN